MLAYIFTFLITSIIALFKNKKNATIVSILLIIILTLFAGTREAGIDNDYIVYMFLFKEAVWNKNFIGSSELSVNVIPNILSWFTIEYIKYTFLIFAFISLSIKLWSIKNYKYFAFAILLYVSNLYFMQDMTTIRASVASGILLWSIKDLVNKNDKQFFIKLVIALFFHYSSIIFIVIWLVNKYEVKYKWLFIALIFSMLVPIVNLNFITILNLDSFFSKAATYLTIKDYEEEKLNLFNFKILISFFYLIIIFWKRNELNIKWVDVVLKIHILSLIFFFIFSTTGLTFSQRTFELLSIIQIILYPLIIICFSKKTRSLGYFIVIATSALFFYYNIYVSDIFKSYSSWLF